MLPEELVDYSHKRLCAMPTDEKGNILSAPFLKGAKLHFHEDDSGLSYILNKNLPILTSWFNEATGDYTTINGDNIPVGSLKVLYFSKLGRTHPRHVHDRKLIRQSGLLPSDELKDIEEMYALGKSMRA